MHDQVCDCNGIYVMFQSGVCVKPADRRPERTRRIARQFLLMWSCFGTRVIRDMTLQSAPSFGIAISKHHQHSAHTVSADE